MKKTRMIPLKSVRTFALTIEATDRLDDSSRGPSRASRREASAELRPCGCVSGCSTASFLQKAPRADAV
jgi:hypothetical protein